MSELKAFELFGNRNGEAIGIDKQNKTLNLNYKEVYLKLEADKVIAEKDKEIAELKRSLIVARHEVAKARGKKTSNKYRVKLKKAFSEDEMFKEAK